MKNIVLITISFVLISLNTYSQKKKYTIMDTTSTIALKEVTIQAEKTDRKMQRIPVSASVIPAREIKEQQLESLTDLTLRIPNYYMPDYGTRLTSPVYIRGIGSRINSPSVGLYVDNVPYLDKGAFDFNFMGIRKIEVLRGPQGTLYGRNTMGGLIKVYTEDPTPVRKGGAYLGYGNYNSLKGSVYYNQPLSGSLFLRGDASVYHRDGFFVNEYTNNRVDRMNTYTGRIKLKYLPSGNFVVVFSADFEKNIQGGYPYALYNDSSRVADQVNYNQPSSYSRDLFTSGLNIKYSGERVVMDFAASYQQLSDLQKVDQDFMPLSLFFVTQDRTNHNLAQELTFHSVTHSRINWVAGVFSFQQLSDKNVMVDYGSDAARYHVDRKDKTYDQPVFGTALYAQATLPLGRFSFTGGLRLDHEMSQLKYDYDLFLLSGDSTHQQFTHRLSFNQWLPKVALTYRPVSGITFYASVAKGYKTGGFNSTFEREEDESFAPETSINYETGIKSTFFKHRLTANVSMFYIDWRNQQVYQPVPSGHGAMLKNAGHSESKGLELELQAIPGKNLRVYGNAGFTQAKFLKYEKDSLHIYNGNYIPYVPRYTVNAGVIYSWVFQEAAIGKITVNLDYQRIGEIYWNVENEAGQKKYDLLNGRVSISAKKMQWGIWGKNLFNTDYATFYFEELGHAFLQKGNPLQAGIFFSYDF